MEFNISEIPICRICLNKVQIGETFFLVNDYAKTSNFEGLLIKNMIQKIVSEIDLEICNHPIICGQCYNLLISTYTFKSKCFETEEKIHEYMKTNGFQVGDKINLTDLIEPETSIVKEEKIDKTENNIDEDIVSSTANDCKEEIDTNGPQVGDKINIVESEIKMEVEEEKTDSTENDTDDDDEDYKEELDVDIEEDDLKPKSKNRNLAYMRRPHKCDICEYKSYNYAYLKKHLKKCKVKQSKEIFKCNKCPYSTTRNRNLNRHMMIHGGDRPYSCGICKKGFTERSHVKRHIARHSGSELSKKKYEYAFKSFMDWHAKQHTSSFSESVLMVYFADISKKFKSSTLWNQYSMLKMMLSINQDLDISEYKKLKAFLKRKSDGYQARKSKTFSTDQINKFISDAPDNDYLLTKVVCIMGIMGACCRQELYKMEITDVKRMGSTALITIPHTKNKITRKFTITGLFYEMVKKYIDLRPSYIKDTNFFLNYQKGKCTNQKVGINKFGSMAKDIAAFLNLADSDMYTGHCFRRTSATILVEAGGDITSLKRHGGWEPTTVAGPYINDSIKNELDVDDKIFNTIGYRNIMPSSSRSETLCINDVTCNAKTNLPQILLNNCTNVTFNFNGSADNTCKNVSDN